MKIIKVKNCIDCPCEIPGGYAHKTACKKKNYKIIDNIEKLPSWCPLEEIETLKNSNWIKVSYQLPEHEQSVDIWAHGIRYSDTMYVDYKDNDQHFFCEQRDMIIKIKDVTYWMQLPLPPGE